jgi:hypothetical protein
MINDFEHIMSKISTNLNKELDAEKIYEASQNFISPTCNVLSDKDVDVMKQNFVNTLINFSLSVNLFYLF